MTGQVRVASDRLVAITRRDLQIEISYQFRLISFFSGALLASFLAFYVSDLIDSDAEHLAAYNGSYFEYVVAGLALTSFAGLGVSVFTAHVTSEQSAGTFEILLSSSTRLSTLLAGGFIVPFGMTAIEVALLLGVGIGIVGVGLSSGGLLVALPIILLTVLNFAALGMVSAALVLLVKRGDPISGPIYQLTLLMSGAIFPVELFPRWLELMSHMSPAYYGVRGLREAILTDGGYAAIVDELAVLGLFAAVTLPTSLWLFSRSVATAKRLGVLGSY